MKKGFIVLCVMFLGLISTVEALDSNWTMTGQLSLIYSKDSGDGSAREGYFTTGNSRIDFDGVFSNGVKGKITINLPEFSDGTDTVGIWNIYLENMWVEQYKPFDVENLRIKFGKMSIPVNQNFGKGLGITNAFSDGYSPNSVTRFNYTGPGAVNWTYGLTGGYSLDEGLGEIVFSTFEGTGGFFFGPDPEDYDSGILESWALQYANAQNAFGVENFGMTVGYVRISNGPALEFSWMLSLGATYTIPEKNLTLALEYNTSKWWQAFATAGGLFLPLTSATDNDAAKLISLTGKYDADPYVAAFFFEQFKGSGPAIDTLTRIGIFVEYALAPDYSFVAEISDYKFSETADVDGTTMAAGIRGKF